MSKATPYEIEIEAVRHRQLDSTREWRAATVSDLPAGCWLDVEHRCIVEPDR